jgi:alanine dehydrogenase
MEIPSIQGFGPERVLVPQEKPAYIREQHRSLRIGIPKEVSNEERRVALAPYGAALLAAAGHDVAVEASAGSQAFFGDEEYTSGGVEVVGSAAQLYARSEVIVKVFPPTEEELELMQEGQILISALHLGNITPEYLRKLMALRVTGIGFEFISDPDGTLPIVRMMHEISGSLAVQVAARLLECTEGGRGVMLGGISGVPPATVVIIGAGVVGEWAARTALGYGAHVIVLDGDLSALRALEHYLGRRITTAIASAPYLQQAVQRADVVIGAMMRVGERSPILVSREMVASMRPGSVIVDLVTDQGGCIETSRPTTFSDPTYVEEGVTHHCVPNMPSNVSRTATHALTNVLVPYILDIGESGSINDALWTNTSLRAGTYVYRRHLTKKSLAALFGMPHRDIELLIASSI